MHYTGHASIHIVCWFLNAPSQTVFRWLRGRTSRDKQSSFFTISFSLSTRRQQQPIPGIPLAHRLENGKTPPSFPTFRQTTPNTYIQKKQCPRPNPLSTIETSTIAKANPQATAPAQHTNSCISMRNSTFSHMCKPQSTFVPLPGAGVRFSAKS